MAALLLCVLTMGLLSALVQAAVVPNFGETFASIAVALAVLCVGYAGSRTHWYRLSAVLAALAPALACIAVGVRNPDDRVWYGFILIAVIVATLFFSVRTAALVAAALFTALCLLPIWVAELRTPVRLVPLLALHGVLSPLLLVAARHQAQLERDNYSELSRIDARLAEVGRLETLTRAAREAGHDLNNLLLVIGGNVGLLESKLQSSSEEIAEIRMAVQRAAALSRRLMTNARGAMLRVPRVNVADVVRGFEPLLVRLAGPDVAIVVRADASALPRIEIHPVELEQVLMNLVVNARDAMQRVGRVTIDCEHVVLDEAHLSRNPGARAGSHVAIAVTDTGSGMDAAALERIFEPFFTTKAPGSGTGLGLAIVRQIVSLRGGHVVVSSVEGSGSCFKTYLPVTTADTGQG